MISDLIIFMIIFISIFLMKMMKMTSVAPDAFWPNADILRGLETEIATFLLFPIILYIFSQYLLKFEERVSQQKSSNIFPNESSSLLF